MLQTTPRALQDIYDRGFFTEQVEGSSRSATVMVPHILALFPRTASVVDVGCGTGVWLQHFKGAGVPHVLGLDGGGALDNDMLLLEHHEFRHADFTKPLRLPDRFDLAISLEVAEHLPPSAAQTFVANLCQLSDAVVFGAAIPGQSGTWHINERWPSYWAALFDAEGYELFDVLRPQVWYDRRVEWWYAQNTLVFVRRGRDTVAEGVRAAQKQAIPALDFVHPRCFEAFRRSGEAQRVQAHAADVPVTAGTPDVVMEMLIAEAEARAINAEARATKAEVRAVNAEERAAEVQARLTAIVYSASWRITKPLRLLTEPFPQLRSFIRTALAPVWRMARFVARSMARSLRAGRG